MRPAPVRRALGCLAVAAALMPVSTAAADPIDLGGPEDCLELAPTFVSPAVTPAIDVHVQVLLDGVEEDAARAALAPVADSYAPLGMRIVLHFEPVNFTSAEDVDLFAQSKAHFGGKRPDWTNLVYTLTSKDIVAGGNTSVAGVADCIGGIGKDDGAFAIGEISENDAGFGFGPTALGSLSTAKVAGHEWGHLFGAHHHYANCAEGAPPEGGDVSPCTLMVNAVNVASLNFSAAERLIVRGHAERYVEPVSGVPPAPPAGPPPAAGPPSSAGAGPGPGSSGGSGSKPAPPAGSNGGTAPSANSACARAVTKQRSAVSRERAARRALKRARGARRPAAKRLVAKRAKASRRASAARRAACGRS